MKKLAIAGMVMAGLGLVGCKTAEQLSRQAEISLPAACAAGKQIPEGLGVVVLHGKTGTPKGSVRALVADLRSRHVQVEAPEMPWSRQRIYDRHFDGAMEEIDAAVSDLKKSGANWIVVAGHSQGANAALRYGATRNGISGVVVLAAGGSADSMVKFVDEVRSSVGHAKEMRADNRGGERATFNEFNNGPFKVTTTADIYLSYLDPEGPAVVKRNAESLKPGTAVLWVFGTRDKLKATNARAYAFDNLPPHPLHTYVLNESSHLDAPQNARDVVAAWLGCLGGSR